MSDETAPDAIPDLSKRFDAIMRERGWRFASIKRHGGGLLIDAFGKHGDWGVCNTMTDGWFALPDPGPTLKLIADGLEQYALESPQMKGDDQ